ncbi:MAG: OsmC family protein [Gemmatimonadota bacterium]|nr:MAG: OsmC family protein [Gemmatimonadota bacterium]
MPEHGLSLTLERLRGFEFNTTFDWDVEPLLLDEPEPIGKGKGPNAARLVGAAVGNCLSASLLFCLEKAKQQVKALKTEVTGTLVRNERKRLRLGRFDVRITIDIDTSEPARVTRCIELFEDYCVVTASVRKGVDVSVVVTDAQGTELYRSEE